MSLVIQHPTSTDLRAIIALNVASMPETYKVQFWTLLLNQFGDLCYVAKIDNKVVGYVVCKEDTVSSVRTGIIISVAVAKEHQSHGIGERLMQEAHRAMRERNLQMAGLQVRKSNMKAIRMYNQLGYIANFTVPHYYHNPEEDGWLMTFVL